MSCGFYVHGDPMPDEKGHEMKSVTPKESGLYKGQVRCENCRHFMARENLCGLYMTLNDSADEMFNLDRHVNKQGCCNGFTPI